MRQIQYWFNSLAQMPEELSSFWMSYVRTRGLEIPLITRIKGIHKASATSAKNTTSKFSDWRDLLVLGGQAETAGDRHILIVTDTQHLEWYGPAHWSYCEKGLLVNGVNLCTRWTCIKSLLATVATSNLSRRCESRRTLRLLISFA